MSWVDDFNWREQINAAFIAEGKDPYYIDTTTPITPFGGFTGTTSNLIEPTGPVSYVTDMVNPLYGGQVATATRPSNGRVLSVAEIQEGETARLSSGGYALPLDTNSSYTGPAVQVVSGPAEPLRLTVAGTNQTPAVVTQTGGTAIDNTAAITALYRELFKREPDAAGLQYWRDVMAAGNSLDYVRREMMKSAEYLALHPAAAVAAGSNRLILLAVAAAAGYFFLVRR